MKSEITIKAESSVSASMILSLLEILIDNPDTMAIEANPTLVVPAVKMFASRLSAHLNNQFENRAYTEAEADQVIDMLDKMSKRLVNQIDVLTKKAERSGYRRY